MVGILPLLLVGATLVGARPGVEMAAQGQPPATLTAAEGAYVVGPGDVLDVTVLDQPDASRSSTVQPSGRLTLPLLGDIEIAGKTVSEIQRLVTELLSKDFLVNPHVEVRVREYASQFVLVLGEVVNPGRRPLRARPRLIDVLWESGGFRATASGEIFIERTGGGTFPNGERTVRFRLSNSAGMTDVDRQNVELILKNGDVITAVSKFYVTVDGEVRTGRVLVDSDATVLGVIAEVGGLGKFGSSKVRIIRRKAPGVDTSRFKPCDGATQNVCLEIDIKGIRKGQVEDLILVPNDKIIVSRRRF